MTWHDVARDVAPGQGLATIPFTAPQTRPSYKLLGMKKHLDKVQEVLAGSHTIARQRYVQCLAFLLFDILL